MSKNDKHVIPEQRYTWKKVTSCATYEDCNRARHTQEQNLSEGEKLKIRRRSDGFELRIGRPLKED